MNLLIEFFDQPTTDQVLTDDALDQTIKAVALGKTEEIGDWLLRLAIYDGTPNEARLAAILLALLKKIQDTPNSTDSLPPTTAPTHQSQD